MNSLIRKSATPFGAIVFAALLLISLAFIAMTNVTHADKGSNSNGGRLITIHDRGTEKVILSKSSTVGDALKEAGISIDSNDSVEPAVTEKLIATDYQVNIYRARPVLVVDGNVRLRIITPYQTAEQIALKAGIVLYPEDRTTLSRVDDLTGSAGLQLTITRATSFVFTLYGKTTIIRTRGVTIAEMLAEKGIKLSKDDRVSLPQDTKITSDMAIKVWREGKQTITVDEAVPFKVDQIKDADREIGYHEIKTPGVDGMRSVTYEISIQDGQEVSRTEIASLTTNNPNNQVDIIGAKLKVFGGTCSDWMINAGIADLGSASELIRRESNCNPYSVNGSSGACGVGQALPCGKTGCDMGDGACQTIWMSQYVIGRYGSWAAALQHSYQYGWY